MDDKVEEKTHELTFEELFVEYDGEPFHAEVVAFLPVGEEKW